MSTKLWKLETDLCRCCHSEGAFSKEVVYSDMLRECFGVELTAVIEPLSHSMCAICDACIQRLREATEFKHQVQDCERRFRDQYLQQVGSDVSFKVEVKKEVSDSDNEDVKLDIFSHNGKTNDQHCSKNDQNTSTRADDGNISDDDFGLSDPWDDEDLKQVDSEEDIQVKEEEKTKNKQSSVASSKVKQNAETPKPEDIVDTIQGVINVVKRPTLFRLRKGINYKRIGDLFICCKCDKEMKSIDSVKAHIKSVHLNIPKYSCTYCSKSFSTLSPFIKHKQEEHNVDDRFKCNACDSDRLFNTKFQLKKHKNIFHMLGEKYKCNVCDFETYSLSNMHNHKFNHKNVRGYHCTYCRKSFKRKSTLQLHEKIHTGDRRKLCKECGQAFVQKASLNYHMMKYHPEVKF